MRQYILLSALCLVSVASAYAQGINVTATGVGIGTPAPAAQFHVKDMGATFTAEVGLARFDYYNGRSLTLLGPLTDNADAAFTFQTSNALQFRVDQTDALIIDAAGNVGVTGNLKVKSAVLAPEGAAPIFAARAWVVFNGSGANATDQTIQASGNVTRVYKNSGGTYTIYFSSPLPDANVCVIGTATNDGNGRTLNPVTISASQVQIQTRSVSASLLDSTLVSIAFFR